MPVNPVPKPKPADQARAAMRSNAPVLAVLLGILAGYAAATPLAILGAVLAAAAVALVLVRR